MSVNIAKKLRKIAAELISLSAEIQSEINKKNIQEPGQLLIMSRIEKVTDGLEDAFLEGRGRRPKKAQ